ncbi:MAG: GGDEF domain-containing protein [Nanobdellota archaeon]
MHHGKQYLEELLEEVEIGDEKIHSIREYVSTLEEAYLKDGLTGLGNRTMLERRLPKEKQKGWNSFAYCMVDIKDFFMYNDMYGMETGDAILQTVAQSIAGNIREADFAARVGGDEFVVLLSDVTEQESIDTMQRVRESVLTDTQPYGVQLHVGIAYHPQVDYCNLAAHADEALRFSKKTGECEIASAPFTQQDYLQGIEAKRRRRVH